MGMFVTLWFPAAETTSRELIEAADNRVKIGWYDLRSLLTPASQQLFDIPQPAHHRLEEPRGDVIFEWNTEGKQHGVYYIRPEGKFLVARQDDPLNMLRMQHSNFELLKQCCLEARNIQIPPAAVAAAEGFQP